MPRTKNTVAGRAKRKKVLKQAKGNVSEAARKMGIRRHILERNMSRLGVTAKKT